MITSCGVFSARHFTGWCQCGVRLYTQNVEDLTVTTNEDVEVYGERYRNTKYTGKCPVCDHSVRFKPTAMAANH